MSLKNQIMRNESQLKNLVLLLRGLGWNDNNDEEKDKKEEKQQEILNHRQKGITLGIGAKPVDHEILQDLQSTEKGIPIIKRRKLK